MATPRWKQEGENLSYYNSSESVTITSGTIIALAALVVIAMVDIPPLKTKTVATSGGWVFTADNATAFSMGDDLFWDAVDGKVYKTPASDRVFVGIAGENKAEAGTEVLVLLNKRSAVSANIVALTNSTGATPDNTIENVPAATAAVTDTTAASLTSVNTSLTALENNAADLAGKVNEIRTALINAGLMKAS